MKALFILLAVLSQAGTWRVVPFVGTPHALTEIIPVKIPRLPQQTPLFAMPKDLLVAERPVLAELFTRDWLVSFPKYEGLEFAPYPQIHFTVNTNFTYESNITLLSAFSVSANLTFVGNSTSPGKVGFSTLGDDAERLHYTGSPGYFMDPPTVLIGFVNKHDTIIQITPAGDAKGWMAIIGNSGTGAIVLCSNQKGDESPPAVLFLIKPGQRLIIVSQAYAALNPSGSGLADAVEWKWKQIFPVPAVNP